jgi:hypothetical protein
MRTKIVGAGHASDADLQSDLRRDGDRRPCPRCSTVLMLKRVGTRPGFSELEVVLVTHGWCPWCDWEGWLGCNWMSSAIDSLIRDFAH